MGPGVTGERLGGAEEGWGLVAVAALPEMAIGELALAAEVYVNETEPPGFRIAGNGVLALALAEPTIKSTV